jgi:RNA-directed DNA polymerase
VNTDAPWPSLEEAMGRVLNIQTKLHRWAIDDDGRRFDDLFNLVTDPAFLTVGWYRVRGNRGARSAGIDGVKPRDIVLGDTAFLTRLRTDLRSGEFRPLPVKQRMIPKANGKLRSLGIPTAADRVVQASLKLVLEPIFEAGFKPCSYGFRPRRRAHDALAEIHLFAIQGYTVVLEGDIKACFDEIDHQALLGRVKRRIGDKRVLGLVKAFLKAGVLAEDGIMRDTRTGTPQGGILSPLLANIALSVLDDHFALAWQQDMATGDIRHRRRKRGLPTYRLVRYADDFVVMIFGTKAHAEVLKIEVAAVLTTMGLALSEEKTMIVDIDEGFEFLGFRIQRKQQWGSNRRHVYTWPSKKSLSSIKAKVKTLSQQGLNQPLSILLRRLSMVLRGWTNYFRHASSKATFAYVHQFTWLRIIGWCRRKHRHATSKFLRRRYLANRWWPEHEGIALFDCRAVPITRYLYRGNKIGTPWSTTITTPIAC